MNDANWIQLNEIISTIVTENFNRFMSEVIASSSEDAKNVSIVPIKNVYCSMLRMREQLFNEIMEEL